MSPLISLLWCLSVRNHWIQWPKQWVLLLFFCDHIHTHTHILEIILEKKERELLSLVYTMKVIELASKCRCSRGTHLYIYIIRYKMPSVSVRCSDSFVRQEKAQKRHASLLLLPLPLLFANLLRNNHGKLENFRSFYNEFNNSFELRISIH